MSKYHGERKPMDMAAYLPVMPGNTYYNRTVNLESNTEFASDPITMMHVVNRCELFVIVKIKIFHRFFKVPDQYLLMI
jgi:hypothetical protein